MKLSIIVPIYNVAQYLPVCLSSVLSQSFCDYEVICVNDGSTDDSRSVLSDLLAECDASKAVVLDQENQGLSAARNAGLRAAKGDYVLFLDSDDWLELNALELLSKQLEDEDIICFNGRRYFEDKDTYEMPDAIVSETDLSGWDYYNRHALAHRNFAFVCVVLRCYRRQFLLENNLWFKPGIFHEDNLFTPLTCFHAKSVKVIPDVLYNYRVRSSSIMTTRSLKHWQDIISTANELAEFFVPKTDIDKTTIYRALTHYYQSAFQNAGHREDKLLKPLVDWKCYNQVSRTKLRHRVQYAAMRISPALYRWVNKLL